MRSGIFQDSFESAAQRTDLSFGVESPEADTAGAEPFGSSELGVSERSAVKSGADADTVSVKTGGKILAGNRVRRDEKYGTCRAVVDSQSADTG